MDMADRRSAASSIAAGGAGPSPLARRSAGLPLLVSAALLLWPALWNGYPIVFADSGTYLSQAVHRYLGWDRPPFYSLFLLPLHLTVTLWPVVIAQALLTTWVLQLVCRALGLTAWTVPGPIPRHLPAPLPTLAGFLALASWLPWLVCEVMPDLFTPLLVLVLCLLLVVPHHLGRVERCALVALAALMIAAQQSSLPLTLAEVVALLAVRHRVGAGAAVPWRLALAPPLLAIAAVLSVNLVGHGRLSLSPYGNVFLLARVIYDGPGRAVLHRDCSSAPWRLCPFIDRLPPTSDEFLWLPDSPVMLAGGHKTVSADADAIIAAALRDQPGWELQAAVANFREQLLRFTSGDGLQPWPAEVSPWIQRDFPSREFAAYQAARQQRGTLALPAWLDWLHWVTALAGVAVCLVLLPLALRRRHAMLGFLVGTLVALPAGALITGTLSMPHDRYQSRVMALSPVVAAVSGLALRRRAA